MSHKTGQDPRWSLATPHLNWTLQDGQDLDEMGERHLPSHPGASLYCVVIGNYGIELSSL